MGWVINHQQHEPRRYRRVEVEVREDKKRKKSICLIHTAN